MPKPAVVDKKKFSEKDIDVVEGESGFKVRY